MAQFDVTVTQDSVDITSSLSWSGVTVIAKVLAARTATYSYIAPSGSIDLTALVGVDVEIEVDTGSGAQTVFTGVVSRAPEYDTTTRVITITATDGWQEYLDEQDQSELETLIPGGIWLEDLDGTRSSGLSQALVLLSSVEQDAFLDADGTFQLVDWTPLGAGSEDGTIGAAAVRDVVPELVNADELINTLTITYEHTLTRRVWNRVRFLWNYLTSAPFVDWCDWYQHYGTDLPTADEIRSAASGTGWPVIGAIDMDGHPGTFGPESPNGELCGAGIGWINSGYPIVSEALNADWYGGQTFAVECRETTTITMTAASSVSAYGTHTGEVNKTAITEYSADAVDADESPDEPDGFTSYGTGSTQSYSDEIDETQRTTNIEALLDRGLITILDTHRQNKVTWSMLVDETLELGQTWTITHPLSTCRGTITEFTHTITRESAISKVTISAYLGGGGSADALTASAFTVEAPAESAPSTVNIANHYGGWEDSPAYDEDWETESSWIGNHFASGNPNGSHNVVDEDDPLYYDVGLYILGPDVTDTAREAVELTGTASYAVEIPATTITISGG